MPKRHMETVKGSFVHEEAERCGSPRQLGGLPPARRSTLGLCLSGAWLLPSSCVHQDVREKEPGEGSD